MVFLKSLLYIILIQSMLLIFIRNSVLWVFALLHLVIFIICFLGMMGLDFIPMLGLLIYVGALAVLFLFVVMMCNLKDDKLDRFSFVPIVVFVLEIVLLIIGLTSGMVNEFLGNNGFKYFVYLRGLNSLYPDFQYMYLGLLLFGSYGYILIILGVLLLVGMMGAVFLCLIMSEKMKKKRLQEGILKRLRYECVVLSSRIKEYRRKRKK